MEIYTEGGISHIPPERKVERVARSNAVRKPQDEHDQSDASGYREQRQQDARDTLEISQAYQELKKAQSDEK